MKICVRNSDNICVFSGEKLAFKDRWLSITHDIFCTEINSDNSKIYEDVVLPSNYFDGLFTYIDEVFALTPEGTTIIEANNAKKKADEDKKAIKENQAKAQTLIDESDITVIRCGENDVKVPAEWKNYRKELRKIIKEENEVLVIPDMPAYPAGT